MTTPKSERIAEILRDEHFKAVVDARKAHLTAKVMAHATLDDDRQAALAEFHALHRLLIALQAAKEENP